ncbi:endonuclease domain-containing protein [uncultured Amnibacterium sp.]|uniref:endonuclease domain-containing protein n=1 Tax=uncultured Amnibacterium sp. TaxID=1631851 RepID=UPI0035CB8EBE
MRRLFWTTAELHQRGFARTTITGMVDTGRLIPIRQGLWAEPGAPDELVRAARAGGAATATTGAAALGLWAPDDGITHLAVPAGASRLRDPDDASLPLVQGDGVCVHWTKRMPSPRTLPDRIAPLLLVLEHAVRCLRPELAVAIIDSALHQRRLRASELPLLAASLPARLRHIVLAADGRADSGLESIVRYLLEQSGIPLLVHPILAGIGEVDLLVGGRLIIETDGKRYHLGAAFEHDRQRDLTATIDGYRTLRLTYAQVLFEWPATFRAICSALALA